MLEAIRFIQDIGVEEIESRNLHLATYAKQALQEIPGVTVLSPLDRRSSTGLVSFTIDGVDTKEAVARLWEQHRIVARWVGFPPGIRIALHFFNTEEEVNKVVEAVQELA
jgi:selenocysteine lyase/cysteine desulfurase